MFDPPKLTQQELDLTYSPPSLLGVNITLKEGWFVLNHEHVEKALRRKAHGRWYRIRRVEKSREKPRSIYRLLRFNPRLPKNRIVLDWSGWLELNKWEGKCRDPLKLRITPVSLFGRLWCLWVHPNPMERLAFRISAVLGGMSLLLGIISLLLYVVS
jgi:hypothetical protein